MLQRRTSYAADPPSIGRPSRPRSPNPSRCPGPWRLSSKMSPVIWPKRHKKKRQCASTYRSMAEIRTVTTLRRKRAGILASITLYEKRLSQARADLSHVTACMAILGATGDGEGLSSYVDTHRMFARGEMIHQCKEAFATGDIGRLNERSSPRQPACDAASFPEEIAADVLRQPDGLRCSNKEGYRRRVGEPRERAKRDFVV